MSSKQTNFSRHRSSKLVSFPILDTCVPCHPQSFPLPSRRVFSHGVSHPSGTHSLSTKTSRHIGSHQSSRGKSEGLFCADAYPAVSSFQSDADIQQCLRVSVYLRKEGQRDPQILGPPRRTQTTPATLDVVILNLTMVTMAVGTHGVLSLIIRGLSLDASDLRLGDVIQTTHHSRAWGIRLL